MRILRPPSFVRSSSVTLAPDLAAKIAAIVPAAPAPTTTIWRGGGTYRTAESNIHPMIHQRVPSWNSVMLFTPRVYGVPPSVRADA